MQKNIDYTDGARSVLQNHIKPASQESKKHFSHFLQKTNKAFLPGSNVALAIKRVVFILPENFSLMSYAAAVDTLVTANLVHSDRLFDVSTYGIQSEKVKSDLGIEISTDGCLAVLQKPFLNEFHLIIVCGGYRCSTSENKLLSSVLKAAAKSKTMFAGIWNGAISFAYAGLMDDARCALHPDNHAFMRERFQKVAVTENTLETESKIVTSAGPASALTMMLQLIKQLQGREIMRAVRDILSCDQAEDNCVNQLTGMTYPVMPDNLRHIIQLMKANIEDPLSIDELADCLGISRRQIERLVRTHLNTSPSRYYLELRITYARRLLLQSSESITNIALACGFVTSSHFSNCFKDYFGSSPIQIRENFRRSLN
ncbi:GlxA family transcriptional regulator [Amphritea opalescens]|uniref:GlxA family transcriptional regulator n=1 Tax=Amphritea opalescens TaxID=2490544 RepID=A0A430KRG2_9GAMM|nr:GlxA family transcriptional regulator [Amphritea opalescens]RTE66072.1 GlxA family transcriptional regulator [Amphritea opalescens]